LLNSFPTALAVALGILRSIGAVDLMTFGNASDEYLDREPLDSHHQDRFGAEISEGQRRLKELGEQITHFKFVKTAMLSRFPDFKPSLSSG
jgi:hypothetical protein